jgi:hypothetical protein
MTEETPRHSEPDGTWKGRVLWAFAIVGGLLVSLWLTAAIVDLSIYAAYNRFIDALTDRLAIDTYLANGSEPPLYCAFLPRRQVLPLFAP